jgi:D-alanyl-D-alanine carboxypeptidase (penicillin-binding protein 5/6)
MELVKKAIFIVLALAAAGLVYLYLRPVPKVAATTVILTVSKGPPVSLPWPGGGQAAIGAEDYGVLASHGAQKPVPIASVAKVITAYAVLSQRPLALGEQGPAITLDSTDLSYFNYYYTHGGSDTNIKVGEKISEYQALQAMLLPSSNNMADSLARWAFGSTADYVAYANQMVKDIGLAHTTVGNASGFNDKTLSTAADLVQLGELALKSPVIAGIVSQPTAKIPVEGEVSNVNDLLGSYGIDGIKTGNTDEAGGCYLFSSKQTIQGQPVELVGAVLDQPNLQEALKAAPPLIAAADSGFRQTTPVKQNQDMGYYKTLWGARAGIIASGDVSLLAWQGQPLQAINSPQPISTPAGGGSQVGIVTAKSSSKSASSVLTLRQSLPGPSFWWRLSHR